MHGLESGGMVAGMFLIVATGLYGWWQMWLHVIRPWLQRREKRV